MTNRPQQPEPNNDACRNPNSGSAPAEPAVPELPAGLTVSQVLGLVDGTLGQAEAHRTEAVLHADAWGAAWLESLRADRDAIASMDRSDPSVSDLLRLEPGVVDAALAEAGIIDPARRDRPAAPAPLTPAAETALLLGSATDAGNDSPSQPVLDGDKLGQSSAQSTPEQPDAFEVVWDDDDAATPTAPLRMRNPKRLPTGSLTKSSAREKRRKAAARIMPFALGAAAAMGVAAGLAFYAADRVVPVLQERWANASPSPEPAGLDDELVLGPNARVGLNPGLLADQADRPGSGPTRTGDPLPSPGQSEPGDEFTFAQIDRAPQGGNPAPGNAPRNPTPAGTANPTSPTSPTAFPTQPPTQAPTPAQTTAPVPPGAVLTSDQAAEAHAEARLTIVLSPEASSAVTARLVRELLEDIALGGRVYALAGPVEAPPAIDTALTTAFGPREDALFAAVIRPKPYDLDRLEHELRTRCAAKVAFRIAPPEWAELVRQADAEAIEALPWAAPQTPDTLAACGIVILKR